MVVFNGLAFTGLFCFFVRGDGCVAVLVGKGLFFGGMRRFVFEGAAVSLLGAAAPVGLDVTGDVFFFAEGGGLSDAPLRLSASALALFGLCVISGVALGWGISASKRS